MCLAGLRAYFKPIKVKNEYKVLNKRADTLYDKLMDLSRSGWGQLSVKHLLGFDDLLSFIRGIRWILHGLLAALN